MSLFKRGNTWHFVLRWNGQRYRGSCKTSRRTEAKKVEALVLARLLEDGRLPWNRKVPILADFSNPLFYMAGIAAGGPAAETANSPVLPGGLATPGVHIHRPDETRSHHGRSRLDHRGIVRREHQ